MPEILRSYVVDLPRRGGRIVEGPIATCLAWIRAHAGGGRVALVLSAAPPDEGPDACVCVPLTSFGAWEEEAAAVTAAWERRWLLIESMPPRHRDEARADLHDAVAGALIAAATNGVDHQGGPLPDVDF